MFDVFKEAADEFRAMVEMEYNDVSAETKEDIISRFKSGQTVGEIRLELGEHLLVVARIVAEWMQASLIESLSESPLQQFKQVLARLGAVYAGNAAEKGDSWRTIPLEDLREKLKEEFLEWMNEQDTPKECSEIIDLCLTALMIGERLLP